MIVPSASHVPPPKPTAAESARVITAPVATRSFLSCWSAVKRIHSPSGEKTAALARSVPVSGVASSWSRRGGQRRPFWRASLIASIVPSGERARRGAVDWVERERESPKVMYSRAVLLLPPLRDHPQAAAPVAITVVAVSPQVVHRRRRPIASVTVPPRAGVPPVRPVPSVPLLP